MAELQRSYANTLRAPDDLTVSKLNGKGPAKKTSEYTNKVYERLYKDSDEYKARKQQYMDWGESTAVLLANTIHTNQTSSQLSQKEERAR